jgi:cobalt-zinc-cadmium efflux system outer membrane protein
MTARTRVAACLLACSLGWVPDAGAQQVTVEQLVALAVKQSPELQAARAGTAMAAGDIQQATLRPNPMLAGSHGRGTDGMTATSFDIEWPLDLFRRPARVAVAARAADVTAQSVRDQERRLASAVREQAGLLLAARRTLEVTTEVLTAARRLRDLLDRRVTEGGTTKLDANVAAVEALRLEADAALAAGEVEAATIELKATAGLPADAPLDLRDSLEGLAASPAVPRLTAAAALSARPDLAEALARIALADARADNARRDARTDVTLVGSYGRDQLGFPQQGLDALGRHVPIHGIFHVVTIGAQVTLPFTNRNQGALASAQAERAGAEALFTARQRAARAEIDAAAARDRETQRAVTVYSSGVRTIARQNVDIMLEAYDLGRFPLSDVLAEQRRYLDVEAAYTAVLLRAYEARAAVARALGELP